MPKTGAERQQAWRDRRARCIAALAAGRAGLAGARGHLAGALTEAGNASTQPPQPTATATPAVTTCGDPSRPPRRRLIAYATNASAQPCKQIADTSATIPGVSLPTAKTAR